MRRIWITLLAVATALVIALPVGAVKPDKLPKPPTSVPIAVFMDAEPVWAHEAADLIHYKVTLENKTGEAISGVAVRFTTTDTAVYQDLISDWDSTEEDDNGVVPANSSVWMKFYLYVDQFTEAAPCLVDDEDECSLLATAEVLVYDEKSDAYDLVTQTEISVPLMPEPACGFSYELVTDVDGNDVLTGIRVEPLNDLCIWTLPEDATGKTKTGVWEITLRPILPDPEARKPLGAWMDVRDGVPGNWCTLAIGDSWGFSDRWKAPYPPDPILTGHVYLPGDENLPVDPGHSNYPTLGLDDGMCVSGGAGGDYFKVGNPKSFYLRADGDVPVNVTVKWVSDVPPPTPDETP